MNKNELTTKIADKLNISQAKGEFTVTSLTETIQEALSDGDTVNLIGFGSFGVKERAARIGRNPQTGAEIQIDARKAPYFKPGKKLKDAVN